MPGASTIAANPAAAANPRRAHPFLERFIATSPEPEHAKHDRAIIAPFRPVTVMPSARSRRASRPRTMSTVARGQIVDDDIRTPTAADDRLSGCERGRPAAKPGSGRRHRTVRTGGGAGHFTSIGR